MNGDRDAVLADEFGRVEPPAHGPSFWGDLEAALGITTSGDLDGDGADPVVEADGSREVLANTTSTPQQRSSRRSAPLLAVAAALLLLLGIVGAVVANRDDDTGVVASDPSPTVAPTPEAPTATPEPADQVDLTGISPRIGEAIDGGVWSGPVRDRSDLDHRMTRPQPGSEMWTWEDPLGDALVGWADVVRVSFLPGDQAHWYIDLAAEQPLAAGLEPGLIIAYGLVLETSGDGVADYLVGVDNDATEEGDFNVWVTDLTTGETELQIGPPYGLPVEFAYPGDVPRTMVFTFLGDSKPGDLDPGTVRFYAWTSATRGGEVITTDYAPDTGWITVDTP